MNKYEIRTRQKKDAIIRAALDLIREKGYTSVSINEIASGSGVSSVSIYNYFGSKEGLIKECARVLLQDTSRMVYQLLAENIGFQEKLVKAVALCTEKPQKLLEEYFSREALDDKVLQELLQEGVSEIRRDILQAFIEGGKREGAVDASLSTETIMAFLDAAAAIQAGWRMTEGYQTKAAELYRLILYGLIGH